MSNSDKMAEFYEANRGDMSLWSDKPAKAKVRRPGSIVFSIRFSREELDEVRYKAEAEGLTVSEFVRRAALGYGAGGASFEIITPYEVPVSSAWALWNVGVPTASGTIPEDTDPVEVAAG